jgi:hypothetical protein
LAKRAPKDDTEKARVANFDANGNLSATWWFIGQNLLVSSDMLSRSLLLETSESPTDEEVEARRVDARIRGSTLMLRGCAVECLLKALYVDAGNALAREGEYIRPPGVVDHDLVALAKAAAFSVSPAERSLLKLLGYWIKQGRYPIMAGWSQYPRFSANEKPLAPNWDRECEGLWVHLRERFRKEGKRLSEKHR